MNYTMQAKEFPFKGFKAPLERIKHKGILIRETMAYHPITENVLDV